MGDVVDPPSKHIDPQRAQGVGKIKRGPMCTASGYCRRGTYAMHNSMGMTVQSSSVLVLIYIVYFYRYHLAYDSDNLFCSFV